MFFPLQLFVRPQLCGAPGTVNRVSNPTLLLLLKVEFDAL